MEKKTLVLGASENPHRYSNIAVNRLLYAEEQVIAVGRRPGKIGEVKIETDLEAFTPGSIHTITLYLNPKNQQPYYEIIQRLRPQRIIFNPGTENPELCGLVRQNGIECIYACTLVMLSTGQY